MKIKHALAFFNISSDDERRARNLVIDSRKMKPNSIFIAIDKGINFINKLKIKPLIILSNVDLPGVYYVSNLKEQLGYFANFFYKIKSNKPHLIGIIGTNGKTSVATILHNLLPKSMVVTTLKNLKDSFVSVNTTPNAIELANDIVLARKRKKHFLILEVSSIGIKEGRVNGFDFDYLIFTNLTSDHLDYHKTLKDYQDTKLNFINNSHALLVANYLDKFGKELCDKRSNTISYSLSEEQIITSNINKTVFKFNEQIIETNLIGRFNILNLSSVLTLLSAIGKRIDLRKIRKCEAVKGRMDVIHSSPNIIIDYAHTSVAMLKAIKEIKRMTKGKLFLIFGAGGERDKSKRQEYGNIALKYADYIILTNDNPRNEDPYQIINDIMGENKDKFQVCISRSRAIEKAIKLLTKDDSLLILGKGHEDYQLVENLKIPYSDYKEVKKWL